VQSVLSQDFSNFELIIIDDASTDDSASVARDLAECDARVRLIHHEQNKGVADTLNEALSLAQAPLIARMDADDECLPQRLGVQVEFMNAHPDIAVAGSYVYHMGVRPRFDHLIDLPTSADEVRNTLKKHNCLYHPSVIFQRSAVATAGGYRADFVNAEDYELWLRLSRTQLICNIPRPLLRYRFSTSGATLGRKWQQLYYVYLAQASNSAEQLSLPAARQVADQLLRKTDRRRFFGDVATGTVAELLQLHLWRDAARVIVSFESELDPLVFTDLARQVLRAAVPHGPPA
jgi:glycosyltransferase involved in cell wall biosynthesis